MARHEQRPVQQHRLLAGVCQEFERGGNFIQEFAGMGFPQARRERQNPREQHLMIRDLHVGLACLSAGQRLLPAVIIQQFPNPCREFLAVIQIGKMFDFRRETGNLSPCDKPRLRLICS